MITHRSGSRRFLQVPLFAIATLAPVLGGCREASPPPPAAVDWPPRVGKPLPDITVLDHKGKQVKLSSFKGRVLLVEPIGMSCPGCIGFCGGGKHGAFEGVRPQAGLGSIDEYFAGYAEDTDINDKRIAVIQMLFFNNAMQTPTQAEAAKWARHFGIADRPNHYVVIGPESLRESTHAKVPGYWLVDRNFVVRCDATGHRPPSNLCEDLLPMVPKLLRAAASPPR